MARAQASKATVKLKQSMDASRDYQFQCWIEPADLWQDGVKVAMSPQQQAIVDEIHQMLHQNGMKLQVTIKQRLGDDPSKFPVCCYADLYTNDPQQQNNNGGNTGGSSYAKFA